MRIRIRGPKGASTLTFQNEATVADLIREIISHTEISSFDVKYGFPPKSLGLAQKDSSQLLCKLGVKLDGEQLTISPRETLNQNSNEDLNYLACMTSTGYKDYLAKPPAAKETLLPSHFESPSNPTSLDTRIIGEVPELPLPGRGATVVLRVMPSDNSCLFRAVGTAVLPGDDKSMPELRSLVASTIQAEREIYTNVVLERSPDEYCRWIQNPRSWGGAIELSILSKHFDVEICSIDVQSLRIDRFNEGRPSRCILVYSGIHYDIIAQSSSYPPYYNSYYPPEMDQRIWDSNDNEILGKALELCQILRAQHYYTDTGKINIKCNICGVIVHGEQQAAQHAQQNSHYDMVGIDQ